MDGKGKISSICTHPWGFYLSLTHSQLLLSTPAYPNTPRGCCKECYEAENYFPPNTPHARAHPAVHLNLAERPARRDLALGLFSAPAEGGSPSFIPSQRQLGRFQREHQLFPKGPARRGASVALAAQSSQRRTQAAARCPCPRGSHHDTPLPPAQGGEFWGKRPISRSPR